MRTKLPCQSTDPELFYSEEPADVQRAKLHCARCPTESRLVCRRRGFSEQHGVWGGLSPDDRRRERPKGALMMALSPAKASLHSDPEQARDRVIAMKRSGASTVDMARAVGRSQGAVRQILWKARIAGFID